MCMCIYVSCRTHGWLPNQPRQPTNKQSYLQVELTIHPDFVFNPEVHEGGVLFWILVEDGDQVIDWLLD